MLAYRRLLADGTTRELAGEVYALTIHQPGGAAITGASVASVIEQDLDGDHALLVLPTPAMLGIVGRIGLRWDLSEVLAPGVRQRRYRGLFIAERAPAEVAGDAPPLARGDVQWIFERDPG